MVKKKSTTGNKLNYRTIRAVYLLLAWIASFALFASLVQYLPQVIRSSSGIIIQVFVAWLIVALPIAILWLTARLSRSTNHKLISNQLIPAVSLLITLVSIAWIVIFAYASGSWGIESHTAPYLLLVPEGALSFALLYILSNEPNKQSQKAIWIDFGIWAIVTLIIMYLAWYLAFFLGFIFYK